MVASPTKGEPLLAAVNNIPAALELQATKSFGTEDVKLVFDIHLDGNIADSRPVTVRLPLHTNETAVIMGPSGIGKSTILKMMCDLQPSCCGAMKLLGRSLAVTNAEEWRRDVLYLHQAKAPLPDSPKDLISSIEKLKVAAGRAPLAMKELLEEFGLSDEHLDRPWNQLSGGEAQRVMLAIGLATKPHVILLDEPTSALDEASKRIVEEAVQRINCGVVWVTHDEQQAKRIGDSVWSLVEC